MLFGASVRRELAKLLASALHWEKGRHYTPVPLNSKVAEEMAMSRCTCKSRLISKLRRKVLLPSWIFIGRVCVIQPWEKNGPFMSL